MPKAVTRTLEEDLLVIFKGDTERVRAYLDKAGQTNRAIEDKQLIRRDGEAAPVVTGDPAPNDSGSDDTDAAGLELELTEETIDEIGAAVMGGEAFKTALTSAVTAAVTSAIATALEPLNREIAGLKKTVTGVQNRAAKVIEDLDADAAPGKGKGKGKTRVALRSSRPSQNGGKRVTPQEVDDGDPDDDDFDDDDYDDDDETERAVWKHRNARADNLLANMP